MSEYRRATAEELAKAGVVLNKDKHMKHINFAKKYYPAEAHTMTLVVHSEYNDSTYDNQLQYVLVHDEDGNELPPIRKTAKECRDGWSDLKIPNTSMGHYGDNESEEPIEDVVIQLVDELPEFYVKVN
jgi:hypothetical protein